MNIAILIAAAFLVLSVVIITLVLKISSQVNERLKEMNQVMQDSNRAIAQSLNNTTGIFGSVQEKLGKLQEANERIYEVGKDISSLQDLLRAPKFRGAMGESLLENLLSQVLPKEHYAVQYKFRSMDTVDAVIRLGGKLIPVDAKFPLENFQRVIDAKAEEERGAFLKKFVSDVKGRIDEISKKYILPEENTYDFALMYIPAENVYYEIIVKQDVLSYSLSKRVIPVSPNTFYAYLQVICLGLKGLKVEENAKQILKSLGMLSNEIGKFKDDFSLVGKHLVNASRAFDDSQKKLERLNDKLSAIQDTKPEIGDVPQGTTP
ncbi:MAG: DNA recombination protein RmuC [Candidatus Omnitrophica bacterium]|nr:DNA recombination protein RmuC [Candidatus Omnitrophota bacterium]MDD5654322.1 DNA recombination protein RmuC [Candidatus Omnitrophota bacterium]